MMHFVRMIAVALSVGVPLGADDSVRSEQLDDILAELQKIRMLLESGQPHRDVQTQSKIINLDVKDALFSAQKTPPLPLWSSWTINVRTANNSIGKHFRT